MNSSNTVKIIGAFLGGIVLAVAGTLLFVKSRDMAVQHSAIVSAPPPPAEAPPSSLPDTDHGPAPAPAATAVQSTPPAPAATAVQSPPPADAPPAPVKRKPAPAAIAQHARHKAKPKSDDDEAAPPVLIAQSDAPAPQNAVPANTTPAANPYASAPPPPPPSSSLAPATPAPAPIPVRQPRSVTIPAGTNLSIRLTEKLSSDTNSAGDAFHGTLEAPLIMNGAVIADRGSQVLGKVVDAQKAGKIKGVSDLQLALTEINTTDGQRVEIQTAALDKQGQSGKAKDAAKVGGGAVLGAIIGAIAGGGKGAAIGSGVGGAAGAGDVLLTRGKSVVIPTETKLSFQLSAPVTITERLNNNQ